MPKIITKLTIFYLMVLCIIVGTRSLASSPSPTSLAEIPSFTDVTGPAGVAATLTSWGASWGHYNTDRFPDLLTYSHERLPELFLNNGDGTFTNIIQSTPLKDSADRHSAAWGDYDNDGDQDVMIAVGAQAGSGDHPTELYQNDNGVLANVAMEAGVNDGLARGRSVSWADFDQDGDLDCFSANHLRPEAPNRLWRNNGDGTFSDVAAAAGVDDSIPLNVGSFIDYDRDGWPDIFVLGISQNYLYHNNGDGTYEDISAGTGLADRIGDAYDWGDYDADGDADIFIGDAGNAWADAIRHNGEDIRFLGVTNGDEDGFDFETPSSQLTFTLELRGPDNCITLNCIHIGPDSHSPLTNPFNVGSEANGTPAYSPGVSSGYYIWRDDGTNLWHVRLSDPNVFRGGGIVTSADPITGLVSIDLEPPPPLGEAMLFRNEGNGMFTDVTTAVGVNVPGHYRSVNWVDIDNDGWLDLFATNKGDLQTGNAPNHLFHNNGDGTFTDATELAGLAGTVVGGANVSAWSDLDQNGFLDLFTQNGGFGGLWPFDEGPNQLFLNPGNANHWLHLELVGTHSNHSGLGAVVHLSAGGRTQVQAHSDGKSAYSQDGTSLHFGLGDNTLIDSLVIAWPSGIHQIIPNVPGDQFLTVIEPFSSTYLPLLRKWNN